MIFSTFLQNLALTDGELAGIIGLIAAFALIFFFMLVALYIYFSLAYFALGKKARLRSPGWAWLPGIGPLLVAYRASKMHWWPWLLIIAFFVPILNVFSNLLFTIFVVIWHWKMFESIKKPNWWAILTLIPFVNLVIIGIAAWSKK